VSGRLPLSKRTRAGLDAEYVDTEGDQGGRKRKVREERSKPRRERQRTRRRNGVPVAGPAGARPAGEDTEPADSPAEVGEAAGSGTEGEGQATPRRRRRRGGRRRTGGEGGTATATEAGAERAEPDAAAS
jgi:hypothetical protein